jgi:4-amino-4-deoxy-L-arabinose transferase-like glycosyltransferase
LGQPSLLRSLLLLSIFVTVWTLYGVISAAPASIHNDMAEAYIWGREYQFGYFQHPPFWAWVAGIWFEVFPRADWAFTLLATLNAGLGLYGSWMLIGDFADADRRLTATVLLLLTPFYTFLALKYNANSIFLSLWPWTMHFFVRSIDNRRLPDAVLFGVFMGLALLSKYYALILGATCFVAALVNPTRRAYFSSASPYVSFGIAALLFAPHVWWLMRSDAPPVRYFMRTTGHSMAGSLVACSMLLVGVVAFHAIVISLIALTKNLSPKAWPVAFPERWREPRFRVLAILAVLPLALTLIAGLAFRLRPATNMTIAIFSLTPLLLLELSGSRLNDRLYRFSCTLVVAMTLTALALSPVIAIAKLRFGSDNNYVDPRKELAREATRIWHEKTGSPLQYVGGSQRYENAVAFYSPDRPHVFIHLDFHRAPWVTPEDLDQSGLLVVCAKTDKKCLAAGASITATPQASRTELTLTHSFWGYTAQPISFIVTVVPPLTDQATQQFGLTDATSDTALKFQGPLSF